MRVLSLGLLGAIALVLAGCGGPPTTTNPPPATSAPGSGTTGPASATSPPGTPNRLPTTGLAATAAPASGPLLGGVLTLAWDHYDLGRRGWLRGRPVWLGRLRVHSTNVLAGLLLIALGASFIVTQGSSALSGVYDDLGLSDLGFRVQEWLADNLNGP